VIGSGHLAMGEVTQKLEVRVAARVGKQHGVAVDSGTSAIMLALRAQAQKHPIKRVGIPTYTCSSVLYAVQAAGCEPVCMDCGDDLRLIPDAMQLATSLDAVVLVHPFGMVEPLAAESWPCPVIEDIAQSAGASLNGKPVGSFGDVAVASFYATKPWGGAYGGMLLTDDQQLSDHVKAMRDPDGSSKLLDYAGHHQLSDLHAAMAHARLDLAENEQQARLDRALKLDAWFEGSNVSPVAESYSGNSYRYIIRTAGEAERWISTLRENGIGATRPVTTPTSRLIAQEMPGAESAWRDCVSLPLLADATDNEMERIRKAVQTCMR
jgi:dTDP-4-amino-4,6-dideoxygalactose transaminase